MKALASSLLLLASISAYAAPTVAAENLVPDPSFEERKEKDRVGHVFAKWSGWTQLTYVGEVSQPGEASHPSFGLMAPGSLWVDDVSVEKVAADVPLTPEPVLGREEQPIAPPGELGEGAVRCVECGCRNMPQWKTCYACGTALEAKKAVASGPPVRLIASFENKSPFDGGTVVAEYATDGAKSLRIDKNYAIMDAAQNWTGYDYVKADVYTDAKKPLELYFEVRDAATRDYWTRVNYTTVVPPGNGRVYAA